MIKVFNKSDIIDDNDFDIIVPSGKELYYKKKYINKNNNIFTLKSFILDNYTEDKKLVNDNETYIFMYVTFLSVKNNLKFYKNISTSLVKNLVNTYSIFYENKYLENDKIADLNTIFSFYEGLLLKHNKVSKKMLYEKVINNVSFSGKYIFKDVDELDIYTKKLIDNMSTNGTVYIEADTINNAVLSAELKVSNKEKKFENTYYYKCLNDIMDEVSYVSNLIFKNIKDGFSYDDILIVMPSVETYEPYLSLRLNHPYYKNEKQGLLTSRFMDVFCDVLNGDFSCDTFVRLLKLNVFDIDLNMINLIDNYVFSWDLEDESFYLPFKYNPNGNKSGFSENDKKMLEDINACKETVINGLRLLLENIVHCTKKEEILKYIYTYLLEEKIINRLFENDPKGVNSLVASFEYINDYFPLECSIKDIVSVFKNLDYTSNDVIDMQNSVMISNLKNANYKGKRIIYLMGMINEDFSKASFGDLINSCDLQKDFMISKIDEKEKNIYHLLSKALDNENVVITYSKLDSELRLSLKTNLLNDIKLEEIKDDKIYDPNVMIEDYSIKLSDGLVVLEDDSDLLLINKNNKHNLNNKISKKAISQLYNHSIDLSPSSVEVYSKCPFYHFCQYGLRLKVKEKYTFDNREVGTFIHHILENILKNDANEVNQSNIDEYVCKYANDYLKLNNKIENKTANYVIKSLSKNVKLVINNIIKERSKTKFKPSYFELQISEEGKVKPFEIKLDDGILRISGIVDRMDSYVSDKYYYRIIDYKTGNKKFRLDDVLDGLNLQMLIYLLIIKENYNTDKEVVPTALLYYPALVKEEASSRSLTKEEKELSISKRLRMNGIVNKDLIDIVEEKPGEFTNITSREKLDYEKLFGMDDLNLLFKNIKETLIKIGNRIYSGDIKVDPIGGRNDACSYCKFSSICKFDEQKDKKRKPLNYKNSEVFKMLEGDYDA